MQIQFPKVLPTALLCLYFTQQPEATASSAHARTSSKMVAGQTIPKRKPGSHPVVAVKPGFSAQEEIPFTIENFLIDHSSLIAKSTVVANSLGLQKKQENEKKFAECSETASLNFKKFGELKGWILNSWLRCAREIPEDKISLQQLKKSLAEFDKNQLLVLKPAVGSVLRAEVVRARLAMIDRLMATHALGVATQVEKLFAWEDFLEKSQKAKLYLVLSDLAQSRGDLSFALQLAQSSLQESDHRATREKISSLQLSLKEPKEMKSEEASIEAEGGFEDRLKQSLKLNDPLQVMEDASAYLKVYPGGKKSKWAQEKILDLYNLIFDQYSTSSTETLKASRERALTILEQADVLRQVEWVKALHRRLDLEGSLRLSEKALDKLEALGNPSASFGNLYWIAGRSAQMLGDYKKAKKYFEEFLFRYSGSDDTPEVLFRLGLVHLRMGQANSAIANFEKLLTLKNIDRYELNARYWLARAYQATNNTKALALIDDLVGRYTFSYYGLRLRLERTSGLMSWPTPLKLEQKVEASVKWLKFQNQTFQRIESLIQQGWTLEAQYELQNFPTPKSPEARLHLAKKFADLGIFPRAIRLVNELTDSQQEFKTLDVYALALPQIYSEWVRENAQKNKLSPYLVKSLIRQESAFGSRALSTSNALGLMQIIPPTAQEIATDLGLQKVNIPDDMYLPELNIQMGSYYLAKVIKVFSGNVPMGLAAYNAGPQRLKLFVNAREEVKTQMQQASSDPLDEMWFDELPWTETSFYVKAILRNTMMYRMADAADNLDRGNDSGKDNGKNNGKVTEPKAVQFESVLWSSLLLR